jgi:hypothetical protein
MNEVSSECNAKASVAGSASFAMLKPLLESVDSLEGVCDREGTADEHLEEPAELRFSNGISSRGLESRLDFGVPECDRFLELFSRDFELEGVLTEVDEGFDELRRWEGSLKIETV